MKTMTEAEWRALGEKLYGPNMMAWRFKCPVCGNVATAEDFRPYKDRGADPNSVTCQCVGRYLPDCAKDLHQKPAKNGTKAPCDYAAYGLFHLGDLVTRDGQDDIRVFPFADAA